jgi:hypothetical protein
MLKSLKAINTGQFTRNSRILCDKNPPIASARLLTRQPMRALA